MINAMRWSTLRLNLRHPQPKDHLRLLLFFTIAARIISYLLLYSCTFLPLFDASPQTVPQSRWSSPLLRWDAFHFAHIAENGYVYEHEWAFFPGLPLLMRLAARILRCVRGSGDALAWDDLLKGGALAALACDTASTLYRLSLHHLRSPNLAFLASLLSLLPSSPATLRIAAGSEPFFTYLSYRGMLCCARFQWYLASVFFALAGTFRSNGILLSGFILWGLIVEPCLNGNKPSVNTLLRAVLLTATTLTPFIYHNYSAYVLFCTSARPAPWCTTAPPSIYAHVQSAYWNVGFLHYWTPQQLPNFILAAPPLVLLFSFSVHHIAHSFVPRLRLAQSAPTARVALPMPSAQARSAFLSPALTPHAIHALFLGTTVLFASHVQIILRLGASMPVIYWAAAWLLVERPRWGGGIWKVRAGHSERGKPKQTMVGSSWGAWWVGWSVVWGSVSLILWGTFLPPA